MFFRKTIDVSFDMFYYYKASLKRQLVLRNIEL